MKIPEDEKGCKVDFILEGEGKTQTLKYSNSNNSLTWFSNSILCAGLVMRVLTLHTEPQCEKGTHSKG